jgi:hypothetical protein
MDLDALDYYAFEFLVGLLLVRGDLTVTRTPARDIRFGADFEAADAHGVPVFVEVKHHRRSAVLPTSFVSQYIGEMTRMRAQHPNARAIFVTSSILSERARELAKIGNLDIWDRDEVLRRLAEHPDVVSIVEDVAASPGRIQDALGHLRAPPTATRSERLAAELRTLPAGREHWRQFEELGTRILTDIFSPQLGAPEVQSRTDDGLDIIDAIFPVRGTIPPWSIVRSEYRSRFAVAEFKNYVDAIGQRQVESIAQYLWHKAFRSFGLLLSRNGYDASATLARRRAWIESNRLIVMLQDEDLIDMMRLREQGDEPFQLIDAQLEDFFRRLSP